MRHGGHHRWIVAAAIAWGLGCAANPALQPPRSVPPGSSLAQIQSGMTFEQVVAKLGPPTSQSRQLTAQAFNPFKIGNEGQITKFHYKNLGRVLFAGPDFRGQGTAVIAIEEDPLEPGYE